MADTSGLGTSLEGNEGIPQGESTKNPPEEHFRDGESASSSETDKDANCDKVQAPVNQAKEKGKEVTPELPLLEDTPFQRTQRQKIVIQLKPVIERLDIQGEIMCSLQSDVNSIFMSQASTSKELFSLQKWNGHLWFQKKYLWSQGHPGHLFRRKGHQGLQLKGWAKFYPLSAQQLSDTNATLAREGHPPISAATFMDMNSLHLVNDPLQTWVESFGKVTLYKISLDRDPYHDFLEAQLVLLLKRMAPSMGPNYSVGPGPFKMFFEKQEEKYSKAKINQANIGTQTRFYEELSSSSRPEEGKEISITISRIRRERDREGRRDKRRVSHDDNVIRRLFVSRKSALSRLGHGVHGHRDLARELFCSMSLLMMPYPLDSSRMWPNPQRPYLQVILRLLLSLGVTPVLLLLQGKTTPIPNLVSYFPI
ncbi:hypothetical protein Taro_016917 [Colocasia esculenta]|uniref:Uncharacterized protein n=1 Tax=Colocasia esculenta TaxID=4460 RepID=A0A843UM46_COLES|nr:hypothetical protein [Colocasia esculenta]